MKAAGDFVAFGIELTAGVQFGHDDLGSADALFLVDADRDTAAIVDYGDGIVVVDGDADFGGMAGEGFIDGIVHHLVDEVVEAHFAGGADVHCGAKAHRLQAFQYFDATGIVNITRTGVHFVCHSSLLLIGDIKFSWA